MKDFRDLKKQRNEATSLYSQNDGMVGVHQTDYSTVESQFGKAKSSLARMLLNATAIKCKSPTKSTRKSSIIPEFIKQKRKTAVLAKQNEITKWDIHSEGSSDEKEVEMKETYLETNLNTESTPQNDLRRSSAEFHTQNQNFPIVRSCTIDMTEETENCKKIQRSTTVDSAVVIIDDQQIFLNIEAKPETYVSEDEKPRKRRIASSRRRLKKHRQSIW